MERKGAHVREIDLARRKESKPLSTYIHIRNNDETIF